MFSSAVRVGRRLKAWKTKPTLSRRSVVRRLSSSPLSSVPPIHACPDVRASRPAMQCMSVDLPDPDGPMMAVNCPRGNVTSTPSSARTSVSPAP